MIAGYFFFTERFLPALRSEPVRMEEGATMTQSFAFRPLALKKFHPLPSDLKYIPDDKAVLLLFYDSTCPACYENLPAWRSAIEASGEWVMILAVAVEEDLKVAEAYARRHLPGAIPVKAEEPRELFGTLGVEIVPYTAFVDMDGALAFARPGRLDDAALAELIRALGDPGGYLDPYMEE